MAVMINESEWARMKAERAKLEADLADAVAKRDRLQGILDDALHGIPDCWPDTEEAVADFVNSITAGGTETPGHSNDCECWG